MKLNSTTSTLEEICFPSVRPHQRIIGLDWLQMTSVGGFKSVRPNADGGTKLSVARSVPCL